MKNQALIVGLGQFGMALARSLKALGVEVIAVDLRPDRVELASRFADEAVSVDATTEENLARLDPRRALREGDVLVIVSAPGAVHTLVERW